MIARKLFAHNGKITKNFYNEIIIKEKTAITCPNIDTRHNNVLKPTDSLSLGDIKKQIQALPPSPFHQQLVEKIQKKIGKQIDKGPKKIIPIRQDKRIHKTNRSIHLQTEKVMNLVIRGVVRSKSQQQTQIINQYEQSISNYQQRLNQIETMHNKLKKETNNQKNQIKEYQNTIKRQEELIKKSGENEKRLMRELEEQKRDNLKKNEDKREELRAEFKKQVQSAKTNFEDKKHAYIQQLRKKEQLNKQLQNLTNDQKKNLLFLQNQNEKLILESQRLNKVLKQQKKTLQDQQKVIKKGLEGALDEMALYLQNQIKQSERNHTNICKKLLDQIDRYEKKIDILQQEIGTAILMMEQIKKKSKEYRDKSTMVKNDEMQAKIKELDEVIKNKEIHMNKVLLQSQAIKQTVAKERKQKMDFQSEIQKLASLNTKLQSQNKLLRNQYEKILIQQQQLENHYEKIQNQRELQKALSKAKSNEISNSSIIRDQISERFKSSGSEVGLRQKPNRQQIINMYEKKLMELYNKLNQLNAKFDKYQAQTQKREKQHQQEIIRYKRQAGESNRSHKPSIKSSK